MTNCLGVILPFNFLGNIKIIMIILIDQAFFQVSKQWLKHGESAQRMRNMLKVMEILQNNMEHPQSCELWE